MMMMKLRNMTIMLCFFIIICFTSLACMMYKCQLEYTQVPGGLMLRVRIVKNELGGSATQQELRGWGHNGLNRGTGELNPQPAINSNPVDAVGAARWSTCKHSM